MWRLILYVIAVTYLGNAAYMWFAPEAWYKAVPGVSAMGPFNLHFVKDIALVYLVSAGAFAWGVKNLDKTALIFGALWPCLHALFHIWIWAAMRGFAFDLVALVNLVGIQVPAWAGLIGARKFNVGI